MKTSPAPSCEQRIHDLERQVRAFRRYLSALAVFGTAALVVGLKPPRQTPQVHDVLRAHRIEVLPRDPSAEESRPVIVLDSSQEAPKSAAPGKQHEKAGPAVGLIFVSDSDGNALMAAQRIGLSSYELALFDDRRNPKVVLSVKNEIAGDADDPTSKHVPTLVGCISIETASSTTGNPGLTVRTANGRRHTKIGPLEVATHRLSVYGRYPPTAAALGPNPSTADLAAEARGWDVAAIPKAELAVVEGSGCLTLSDAAGKRTVRAYATGTKGGRFEVLGENEMLQFAAYCLESGDGGGVAVFNRAGAGVVSLSADTESNGEVGVWDRNGRGRVMRPKD